MEKQFCFDYEHYAALSELSKPTVRLVPRPNGPRPMRMRPIRSST